MNDSRIIFREKKISLTSVELALEVEVQLEHTAVKNRLVSSLMRELPFAVDNPERNVLVWRARLELDQHRVLGARLLDNLVRRRLGLVDKIRVKQVELVTLDDLRWRVVVIVMCLVVLVPFITGMHTVEESGLSGSVLVLPHVSLCARIKKKINKVRFLGLR